MPESTTLILQYGREGRLRPPRILTILLLCVAGLTVAAFVMKGIAGLIMAHVWSQYAAGAPFSATEEEIGGFLWGITGIALLAESHSRFVLVRSYRHALGSTIWDLPRGFIDPGENAAEAALRELTEETGLRCAPANLVPLGVYAPEPGTMAVRAALFAAIHCEGTVHQTDDELGLESIHLVERDKMAELVASGEIEDAGTLIAYYRYCGWQAGPRKS